MTLATFLTCRPELTRGPQPPEMNQVRFTLWTAMFAAPGCLTGGLRAANMAGPTSRVTGTSVTPLVGRHESIAVAIRIAHPGSWPTSVSMGGWDGWLMVYPTF